MRNVPSEAGTNIYYETFQYAGHSMFSDRMYQRSETLQYSEYSIFQYGILPLK